MSKRVRTSTVSPWADRRGVSTVEYAIMAGVISAILVFVFRSLGGDLFMVMVNIVTFMHMD